MITTRPKTFHLYLLKDVDKKLKHRTEFIIKHNKYFAKYKVKNEIDQLLYKYKHGKDIHEHGK